MPWNRYLIYLLHCLLSYCWWASQLLSWVLSSCPSCWAHLLLCNSPLCIFLLPLLEKVMKNLSRAYLFFFFSLVLVLLLLVLWNGFSDPSVIRELEHSLKRQLVYCPYIILPKYTCVSLTYFVLRVVSSPSGWILRCSVGDKFAHYRGAMSWEQFNCLQGEKLLQPYGF